ncbi:MAG: O-antigen ligase family protein [Halanaerobiales bacterium]
MVLINKNEPLWRNIVLFFLIFMIGVVPLIFLNFNHDASNWERTGMHEYVVMDEDNIYKPKLDALLFAEIILLLYSLYLIRSRKIKINYHHIYIPLLIFLFLLILSTVFSKHRWIAFYGYPYRWEGLLAYLAYILLFVYIIIFISKRDKLIFLVKTLLVSGSLITIYGYLQLFRLDFIDAGHYRERFYPRMFSTLGNPNFAGTYISMLLPLAFVLFLYAKNRRQYIITGVMTAGFYGFLIGTSTRGCWLTFAVIFLMIVWLLREKIRKNYKPFLILVLAFILITAVMDYYQGGYITRRLLSIILDMERLTDRTQISNVGSHRMFIYQHSIALLWENPLLGSGLDTFRFVFPQAKFMEHINKNIVADKAHCEYLQLAITAGIPALLAYLWLVGSILKRGYRNLKKNDKYQQGLFMAMLAYLIQATFNISVVSVAPVFWAVMGMNVVINCILRKGKITYNN